MENKVNGFRIQRIPFYPSGEWQMVRDGNPVVLDLFSRHYSKYRYKDGRITNRIVGPGERIVLITQDGKALFVWKKFKDASGQRGVNCSVFRNEGPERSSDLILRAEVFAQDRWPNERFYTYVNAAFIQSRNPGYCFKMAGWKACGITKTRKLIILATIYELGQGRQKISCTYP